MYPVFFTLFYSSHSHSITATPLQVGDHEYGHLEGSTRIEVIPIRTMLRGLCYKLKLSDPLPLNPDYFMFAVSSFSQGEDEMEKINLMIAANDTWQGIVGNSWPYSKGQKISRVFFMMSQLLGWGV